MNTNNVLTVNVLYINKLSIQQWIKFTQHCVSKNKKTVLSYRIPYTQGILSLMTSSQHFSFPGASLRGIAGNCSSRILRVYDRLIFIAWKIKKSKEEILHGDFLDKHKHRHNVFLLDRTSILSTKGSDLSKQLSHVLVDSSQNQNSITDTGRTLVSHVAYEYSTRFSSTDYIGRVDRRVVMYL